MRQQEAEKTAHRREHQRFDDELLEHAATTRAHGKSDGQLLATRESTRQEQIGDVRAGDEQDEGDRREQHDQRLADIADNQLLERNHGRAPAGVVLRILALETRGDDVELGARLRDGGVRLEPRDHLGVVIVPDRAFSVRVCERDQKIPGRQPPRRDGKPRRQHTNDGVALAVERERTAEDVRRSAELVLPEPVAHDDDPASTWQIFVGTKGPAECRARLNHLEEPGADRAGENRFRIAAVRARELPESINRHAGEPGRCALPVVEVRGRHREGRQAWKRRLRRHMKETNEAIGLVVRQRPQQDGIDDAENGGVGADAEGEDQNHAERKSWCPKDAAHARPKVREDRACERIAGGPGVWRPRSTLGRRQRRQQATEGLPPEPSARLPRCHGRARSELFVQIADDVVTPFGRHAQREQPVGQTRRTRDHLGANRCSRPSAMDRSA